MDELEKIRRKKMEELMAKTAANDTPSEYPSQPLKIDDLRFDAFVKKYPFSLIDCWAEWCAPCRTLGPIIDALASELKGKVVFGKLNVDENPKTAAIYGIQSIPTMLVFKDGRLVDQFKGALPKEHIKSVLLKHKQLE